MTNTALRAKRERRSKKRNDPVKPVHISGITTGVADDDDDFEPPIQSMMTKQPQKLKVNRKHTNLSLEDDDDDFEEPIRHLIVKRGENTRKRPNTTTNQDGDDFEPVKKKQSKNEKQMDPIEGKRKITGAEPIRTEPRPYYDYHHDVISLRCSPSGFLDTVKHFTEAQVADVKSIGFGDVLNIKLYHISTRLGYWLVRNYDEQYSTLNIGNHKIKITRDSVHDVFGIPKGNVIVREKNKPRKGATVEKNTATQGAETTIDEFKNQWPDTNKITHTLLARTMSKQTTGGRLFKLNFLAYWNTLFVEITKSTTVKQSFLLAIDKEEDIPNLDWCSFVLESLKRTRQGWKKLDSQYNGPVAFLTLLYSHYFNQRHKIFDEPVKMPVIQYVTSGMIDDVEEYLYNNGPLSVEDCDEVEEDEGANDNRQDQQHVTASRINGNDHQNQEAMTAPFEIVKQNTSTLYTDLFADNIPIHEAAAVQENLTEFNTLDQRMEDTDEYMIPPVDTTHVYNRRNLAGNLDGEDPIDEGDIPSNTDWFDRWNPNEHISALNLDEMDIGTQTQKEIDYCSTPVQLTGVIYDHAAWEASKKSKKVLLKTMDNNIKKYISLVSDMNNLVKGVKEKYFWDVEIMERCKRWNDTVKNTVSTNTVSIPDEVSYAGDEVIQNKVGQCGETNQELDGDGDARLEHENTVKDKGCDDVHNTPFDDGGISDTCLAALQTIEPGIYRQTTEVAQADVVNNMDQPVNLAECSQQQAHKQNTITGAYDKEKPPTTSADEPDEVTEAEMQSVETLLKLAPILQTSSASNQKTPVSANTNKTDDERHTHLVRTRIKMIREKNEKRMAELGDAYRSPYCNRVTDLYEPLLARDQTIICYLLAPVGDIGSLIYKSDSGVETLKIIFETFHPSQYISYGGMDAFVDVLNFEEKKRDKKSSPYRLFLPTTILQDEMFEPKITDSDRLKVFGPSVDDILCKYQVKKVDKVDLIFIPVLLSDHYWCLCFNMKNGDIELIDNYRYAESFTKRYRGRPEKLRRVLILYIKGKIGQREWITKLEKAKIIRKEMDWRTLQNGCDCGVFTMRHMETYKGKSPWDADVMSWVTQI
ncbi:putative Ulp1 protease family catalytic domain, papain-like cysteine peptidase superfamily [Helianthus annuus]|nr:putative Ulp1 protease family catalytic domain, papain-like cysteine peptidase superfamily [Helianthus annuus]